MRAKSFFYVSLGILALALAYHLGATTATAQAPGNPVVAAEDSNGIVYTANGDVYLRTNGSPPYRFQYGGSVFYGPTPAAQPTFGQLKAKYR